MLKYICSKAKLTFFVTNNIKKRDILTYNTLFKKIKILIE